MNPIAIFKEVEADLASFGSISGSIRDKVKAGVAALRQIEADVTTMVEFVTKQAQGALDSLQAVAAESTAAVGAASPAVTTTQDGSTVTVDPSIGTTTHEDPASGVTTTVPHDGTPPTAVETATVTPVTPLPAAVAAAVDATAAVGVTVPAAS